MIKPEWKKEKNLASQEAEKAIFGRTFPSLNEGVWFFSLLLEKTTIAVAELRKITPETYEIARLGVIVPARKQKIGAYTIKFLETKAKSLGAAKVCAFVPLYLRQYFMSQGYFLDATGEISEIDGELCCIMYHEILNRSRRYQHKRS